MGSAGWPLANAPVAAVRRKLHLGRQYRRIPFACREAAPRKWEKEWEEKLLIKPQIMSKIIEIDPQMLINIGLSKKDLIRGYRKMASMAQIYWNTPI